MRLLHSQKQASAVKQCTPQLSFQTKALRRTVVRNSTPQSIKFVSGEEPSSNVEEVSIFKRPVAPAAPETDSQVMQETRDVVGKVLYIKDNLGIVSGLGSDAPIGTRVTFLSGGIGVVLWHRSDELSFVIILGGTANITVGEAVECTVTGTVQEKDENDQTVIRKTYELFNVPTGDELFGCMVDFLGRPHGSAVPVGMSSTRPMVNVQIDMAGREQICDSMLTGVKCLDALTALGRGQCMLVAGPGASGKSSLVLDAVMGQRTSGVKCVYAATNHTDEQVRSIAAKLEASGALQHTALVTAGPGAPLGERFAAMCTAVSIGERVRDEGGHALVVLDDIHPLPNAWQSLLDALIALGPDAMRQGLIKDRDGKDSVLPTPESNEEEMVDYAGMLVSGSAAQRRGFFSSLFQRAAKMSKAQGGGSLTLLPVVRGRPSTGTKVKIDMSKYQTLSEEQKAKILKALEAKAAAGQVAGTQEPGAISTETVEEFMSICDGQLILDSKPGPSSPYLANPKLSQTRIGNRAFTRAMESVASAVRLQLAQAEDARKFAADPNDPVVLKYEAYNQRMQAALRQAEGRPVPLEEQVAILFAIQQGHADKVPPAHVDIFLSRAMAHLRSIVPEALQDIATTKLFTATAEKKIGDALRSFAASYVQ